MSTVTKTTSAVALNLISRNKNAKVGGAADDFITICASCDQEKVYELLMENPDFMNVRVIRGSIVVTPLMAVIHSNMTTNSNKLDMVNYLLAQPTFKLGRLDEIKRTDLDHAIIASPYLHGLLTKLLAHPTCQDELINYNTTRFCSLLSLASGDATRLQEFLNACIEYNKNPDFHLVPSPRQFINSPYRGMSVLNVLRFKSSPSHSGGKQNPRAYAYKRNLEMINDYIAFRHANPVPVFKNKEE
jgi:hypothetical protein